MALVAELVGQMLIGLFAGWAASLWPNLALVFGWSAAVACRHLNEIMRSEQR